MKPDLWVPGAGGPSLDDLVARILRTIESYAQRHDVERPHVEVTLHDGTRFALHSLRPEPGFGLVTLCPFPEGEEATTDRLLGWYSAVHSRLTAHIKPEENTLPTFNLPVVTRPPDAVQGVPGRN